MSKITDLLQEVGKDVLTEESLQTIETAFNEAVDKKVEERVVIATEAALTAQDEQYANKLEQLIEAIDKDHTRKLEKVVEAFDKDRTRKLKNVIRKYQTALNEEANNLKDTIVESVSTYLDSYIEEAIPTQAIEEATRNRRAYDLLSDVRKSLAVDMVLANESIRDAVVDGKKTIEESKKEITDLAKSNKDLKSELDSLKKDLFLEKKLSGFEEKKSNFIRKTFNDKELSFIEENFDYTVKMFDKKAEESLELLKEEAVKECKTKDAEVKTVTESVAKPTSIVDGYAQELANMRL